MTATSLLLPLYLEGGRVGGCRGACSSASRGGHHGGRLGLLHLMTTGDRAEPLAETVHAGREDEHDDDEREVVDNAGLDDDVERCRDVEAVELDDGRQGTVVEDDGQPHSHADHPRPGDPLEGVARLGAGVAVLQRVVDRAEPIVCQQQEVQHADGAAREVGAHPHGAQELAERPQPVHGVHSHGGHHQDAYKPVGNG